MMTDLWRNSSRPRARESHIAYRVENIEETLAELKAKGIRLIDEKPRKGGRRRQHRS